MWWVVGWTELRRAGDCARVKFETKKRAATRNSPAGAKNSRRRKPPGRLATLFAPQIPPSRAGLLPVGPPGLSNVVTRHTPFSIRKRRVHEHLHQRVGVLPQRVVDVLKALAGKECRHAAD